MNLISSSTATSPIGYFRPTAGASFALIDKLPVLFSEDDQKLFELNEIAAFIWCSMQEDVPLEVICDQLIDRGLNSAEARDSLRHALSQWLDAGLVVPQVDAMELAFGACVGRRLIEARASDTEILGHLRSLFVTTTVPGATADATFIVHRLGNTAIVMLDERKVFDCAVNALAPTFRSYLVENLLLSNDERDVIFHAAAVTSGDRSM
ncbi:MAG: PqqD family protein, partial [Alcaligenaceae bacterium]